MDEWETRGARMADAMTDLMNRTVAPLMERVGVLEEELRAARAVDRSADIARAVADAVAALPAPVNGKDVDMVAVGQMIDAAVKKLPLAPPGKDADPEIVASLVAEKVGEAVAALPKPENGKDADPAVIAEMVAAAVAELPPAVNGKDADPEVIRQMVAAAVAAIPVPADGRDADPDEVERLVTATVERVLGAWDKPQDGKSITLEDVAPMIERGIADAVAALPPPKDGAPGKLPLVKAWEERVYYEGDVAERDGSTWQALRDTGKAPPHEDWICIAAAGGPGADARQIEVKGTYDPDAEYGALSIVALNGGAFISRKDNPGACPGEGWQVIAMRGKPGEPGKAIKGDPGKSIKGEPGPGLAGGGIDGSGMLTLVNGDGSTVEIDLYPLLSKIDGAR